MSADFVALANELLLVSGIERVVSVDDLHRPGATLEEALGLIGPMDSGLLSERIAPLLNIDTDDPEVIRRTLRSRWESMEEGAKGALLQELKTHSRDAGTGEEISNDIDAASKLPSIFTDKLAKFSYKQWVAEGIKLISPSMPPTLLLIDLDYSGEQIPGDAGIGLIQALLTQQPEAKIFCGLLTNKFPLDNIHENWRAICNQHGLDEDRFVLIPKKALYEDVARFLALIKLVVLGGHARRLTGLVKMHFEKSVETAVENLGRLDTYEFEQIVCVSSYREGVWEPDTLARAFALFHRRAVHDAVHADDEAYTLANTLRQLSRVKTGNWGAETPRAVELRRLEWFEDAGDLNRHLAPIETGDIFLVEGRPDKRYILVSQPCDLMVRSDGKRDPSVENGLLLEAVRDDKRPDNGFGFLLEFYEQTSDWRVNLRKCTTVCLDVLDLCALREDGRASVEVNAAVPIRLNEAWSERAGRLQKWAASLLRRYGLLTAQGLKHREAESIATNAWMGKFATGSVDAGHNRVSYNIMRVGRLKQPRAGALLSRYANSLSRDAFEHDLARREAPAVQKT